MVESMGLLSKGASDEVTVEVAANDADGQEVIQDAVRVSRRARQLCWSMWHVWWNLHRAVQCSTAQ